MLTQRDILEATKEKLKNIPRFNSLKVYLDESKENFETPCFFLKLIKTTRPDNVRAGRTTNECLLVITYFAEKGENEAVDLYDVKDEITAAFWKGLKVQERWIHFEEVSSDTEGEEADIIYMQLPFTYMDAEGEDEIGGYMIGAIHQKERSVTGSYHCR